jgi:hypothetical protein
MHIQTHLRWPNAARSFSFCARRCACIPAPPATRINRSCVSQQTLAVPISDSSKPQLPVQAVVACSRTGPGIASTGTKKTKVTQTLPASRSAHLHLLPDPLGILFRGLILVSVPAAAAVPAGQAAWPLRQCALVMPRAAQGQAGLAARESSRGWLKEECTATSSCGDPRLQRQPTAGSHSCGAANSRSPLGILVLLPA